MSELALLLANILKNLRNTPYPDVARYRLAVAPDLGLDESDIRTALEPDLHPALAAIHHFLATITGSAWTGAASGLLSHLPHSINMNPNHLTRLLRRHHAQLPGYKISLTRTKSNRTLTFSKTCNHRHPPPSPPPSPAPVPTESAVPNPLHFPPVPLIRPSAPANQIRHSNTNLLKYKFDKSTSPSDNSQYDSPTGEPVQRDS